MKDGFKTALCIALACLIFVICYKLFFIIANVAIKLILAAIVVAIIIALANWIYQSFFR